MPDHVDVRAALTRHGGLAAAALELASADEAALGRAAGDAEVSMRERLVALCALAIRAARGPVALPPVLDLLDDAPLIDAALAAGLAGAVCGLAQLEGVPASQRRYLVKIAAGAGAAGLHVAALALAADEPAIAARAAAPELRAVSGEAAAVAVVQRAVRAWATAPPAFWSALAEALGGDRERVASSLSLTFPDT